MIDTMMVSRLGEHKQVKGTRAERAKYRTCNEVNRGIDPE